MRDRGEVVVGEHDLGRFFCGLRSLVAHRDANVRALERGRVVHPVSGHRNDLAAILKRDDKTQLVLGACASEDIRLEHGVFQRIIRHLFEIAPGQRPVGMGKPEIPGDGGRGRGVIASDHLDGYARRQTFVDRRDSFFTRGIDQSEQPDEREPFRHIRVSEIAMIRPGPLRGERQHALAPRGDRVDLAMPEVDGERTLLAVHRLQTAHFENALRRALHEDEAIAVMIVMKRRHVAVLRLERDFVGSRKQPRFVAGPESGFGRRHKERAFGRVAVDPPLAFLFFEDRVTTEHRAAQRSREIAFILDDDLAPAATERPARRVSDAGRLIDRAARDDGPDRHFIACQRSRLVGADCRDRTERLHRRQTPHDRVASRHSAHAHRQSDGDDRGQALRNGGHRQSNRDHEHFAWGKMPNEDAKGVRRGCENQDRRGKPAPKSAHAPQQRGRQILHLGEHGADPTDFGRRASRDHDSGRLAICRQSARKRHRSPVAEQRTWRNRLGTFFDGSGFAR